MRFHLFFLLIGATVWIASCQTTEEDVDCEEETTTSVTPTEDYECEAEETTTPEEDCEAEPTSTEFPESICPEHWTPVTRRAGIWCLRVFQGAYEQALAERECKKHSATVSGAETPEERMLIADLGRELMQYATTWRYGTLRVGFTRCDFARKWILTDQHTYGIGAFGWANSEPGKGSTSGVPHNCVQMWFGLSARNRNHSEFYTDACTSPTCPGLDVFRGYVCGKMAEV